MCSGEFVCGVGFTKGLPLAEGVFDCKRNYLDRQRQRNAVIVSQAIFQRLVFEHLDAEEACFHLLCKLEHGSAIRSRSGINRTSGDVHSSHSYGVGRTDESKEDNASVRRRR